MLTSRSLLGKLGSSVRDKAERKSVWSWEVIVPGLALHPNVSVYLQPWTPKDIVLRAFLYKVKMQFLFFFYSL